MKIAIAIPKTLLQAQKPCNFLKKKTLLLSQNHCHWLRNSRPVVSKCSITVSKVTYHVQLCTTENVHSVKC